MGPKGQSTAGRLEWPENTGFDTKLRQLRVTPIVLQKSVLEPTSAAQNKGWAKAALEGKGPQKRPQRRLDNHLEGVAKAVGRGYCRLQMPLKPALGVRETVAGHRLGAQERGEGVPTFPSNASLVWALRPCSPAPPPLHPAHVVEEGGGGRGFGTQKCVDQKWPKSILPFVNFMISPHEIRLQGATPPPLLLRLSTVLTHPWPPPNSHRLEGPPDLQRTNDQAPQLHSGCATARGPSSTQHPNDRCPLRRPKPPEPAGPSPTAVGHRPTAVG